MINLDKNDKKMKNTTQKLNTSSAQCWKNVGILESQSENVEKCFRFRIFQIEETMSMSRVKESGGGSRLNYFSLF